MGYQQLGRRRGRREEAWRKGKRRRKSDDDLFFKLLFATNVVPAYIIAVAIILVDTTWQGSFTTTNNPSLSAVSLVVSVVQAFSGVPQQQQQQQQSRWITSQRTYDDSAGRCHRRRHRQYSLPQAFPSSRRRLRRSSALAVSKDIKADMDGANNTRIPSPISSSNSSVTGNSNPQQEKQSSAETSSASQSLPLTNAVIRISYDGTRFTGWSYTNRTEEGKFQLTDSQKRRRRRRSKKRGVRGEFYALPHGDNNNNGGESDEDRGDGFVRSVEFVLKQNLAKIYGNVDVDRVVVEGCSRTDKGVHATGMIAHIYCLSKDFDYQRDDGRASTGEMDGHNGDEQKYVSSVIPGKRKPHPTSSTDDVSGLLQTMPFNGNLGRLAFALNRMRPADLQITGISPTPVLLPGDDDSHNSQTRSSVFHASTSSVSKTYEYRISTGQIYDPTKRRTVWHTQRQPLDFDLMKQACATLEGKHDFSAFQGTPRGSEDRKKRQQRKGLRQSICNLHRVTIEEEKMDQATPYFDGVDPPIQYFRIVVTGDRFLYKMMRFLVGAIVAVGSHKLHVGTIQHALAQGNWIQHSSSMTTSNERQYRRHEFECAPPHGLVLSHINYGPGAIFDWQPIRDSAKTK